MLVCLAAAFAMLQVNLLLPLAGKLPSSFVVMDLAARDSVRHWVHRRRSRYKTREPCQWRHHNGDHLVRHSSGPVVRRRQLFLGIAASVIATLILWALKWIEHYLTRECRGTLHVAFSSGAASESDIRQRLLVEKLTIVHWTA